MEMISSLMSEMEDMRFISVDDFFVKKRAIKSRFNLLSYDEKEVYKWYFFYQLCIVRFRDSEKRPIKDVFWDYLNDLAPSELVNKIYLDYCISRDKNS